jgi:hypothetical protein
MLYRRKIWVREPGVYPAGFDQAHARVRHSVHRWHLQAAKIPQGHDGKPVPRL